MESKDWLLSWQERATLPSPAYNLKAIRNIATYVFGLHFNIILPSMSWCPKWFERRHENHTKIVSHRADN
jgi:hypothetical protein